MSSNFIRSAMTGVALGIFSATFPSLVTMSLADQQKVCILAVVVAIFMLWFDYRDKKVPQAKEPKKPQKPPKPAPAVKAESKTVEYRGRPKLPRHKRRKR